MNEIREKIEKNIERMKNKIPVKKMYKNICEKFMSKLEKKI